MAQGNKQMIMIGEIHSKSGISKLAVRKCKSISHYIEKQIKSYIISRVNDETTWQLKFKIFEVWDNLTQFSETLIYLNKNFGLSVFLKISVK